MRKKNEQVAVSTLPSVVLTISSDTISEPGHPLPAISFKLAVDEFGDFMRHAIQAPAIGNASARPTD